VHLQVVFLDHQPGPDDFQQFVLADHPLTPIGQGDEQVEGAGPQLGRHAVHQQLPGLWLHDEAAEGERLRGRFLHGPLR
jgi:hypothetical protein